MKKIVGDFTTEILLSKEEAVSICNLGKGSECCAFLVCGTDGFECIRMSYPRNSSIFNRLDEGTMNAKGRGEWAGCPWSKEA